MRDALSKEGRTRWRGLRRVKQSILVNVQHGKDSLQRKKGDLIYNERQAVNPKTSVPQWCLQLAGASGSAKSKQMGSIWLADRLARRIEDIETTKMSSLSNQKVCGACGIKTASHGCRQCDFDFCYLCMLERHDKISIYKTHEVYSLEEACKAEKLQEQMKAVGEFS